MISAGLHRAELRDRIDSINKILDETQKAPDGASAGAVSRETRGLAIVLLFGCYENLLTSLTKTLLEAAIKLRVSNNRLQPGFRLFALTGAAKSIKDTSDKKLYTHSLPKLVTAAHPGGRVCTIDPAAFPNDGSFMKRSQVEVWCSVFAVPHPAQILSRIWDQIDSVVADRNGIAHGRLTPDEVGRNYSENEIRTLTLDWGDDWAAFLDEVENLAQSRDFFRKP